MAMTVRDGKVFAPYRDVADPDKFTGSPLREAASLTTEHGRRHPS